MSDNRGNKRGHHGRYRQDKPKANVGERGREVLKEIDESNSVIKAFRLYASELDDKHDRYERVVKLSRDVTIESKRIIFLLHNVDKENKRESILSEAETRLQSLINNNFKKIAKELENQDHFLYSRAYTAGLQEFIEAFTFYQYLKVNNRLPYSKWLKLGKPGKVREFVDPGKVRERKNYTIEHWSHLEKQMKYEVPVESLDVPETSETNEIAKKQIKTPLPAIDFILGIADLTGELMRKCINNLGSGNIDDCFQLCNFVKELYKGFLVIGGPQGYREIGKKTYVLKQSLDKMELVCYNIIVRGSEIPKHMLATIVPTSTAEVAHDDDDEGFY